MKTVIFKTEEFTCPSCIKKIEKALSKQKGVDLVTVLFNAGKVRVSYKEAFVTPAVLMNTLNKLGYQVLSLKVEG